MECPHCNSVIDYCPGCGNLLPTNSSLLSFPKYCRHCGELIERAAKKYCRHCGQPLAIRPNVNSFVSPPTFMPSPENNFFAENPGNAYAFLPASHHSSRTVFAQILFESSIHNCQLIFPLEKETCLIGREDCNAGIFPEIELTAFDVFGCISRRHARIFQQDNHFFIEDLGSSNGTFVYEHGSKIRLPLQTPFPLRHGSRIHIGNVMGVFSVARGTRPMEV